MSRPALSPERLITIAEFEKLPKEDAYRVELVRGRLVRSPRPAMLHGRLLVRLAALLDDHVDRQGLGVVGADVGVVLERNPDTVRGPDIAFYSKGRISEHDYAVTFWGAPDLAVEITSRSERTGEIRDKLREYLAAGTRQVWVVDPRPRTVAVHTADGLAKLQKEDQVLDGGEVVPGFRLPLASLFAL